jgi:hypothetical protein
MFNEFAGENKLLKKEHIEIKKPNQMKTDNRLSSYGYNDIEERSIVSIHNTAFGVCVCVCVCVLCVWQAVGSNIYSGNDKFG